MTRRFVLATGFSIAAALGLHADATVERAGAPAQDPSTLTGCVRTGSASTVYILRGAAGPAAFTAHSLPDDYLIVSVPNSVNLADQVNHRVEVQAVVSDPSKPPAAPQSANAAERALKRLTVRQLKEVAPNCAK